MISPDIRSEREVSVQMNKPTSGIAYNLGLSATSAPVVVFAHQDVYLPKGWGEVLEKCLLQLDEMDPEWAIAGVVGIEADGHSVGKLWSTGLGREIGKTFYTPVPAVSLDEVVLIVRRASGLRFDEKLPSFHLYGTDVVQTSLKRAGGAYIICAPLIHNSTAVRRLDANFMSAYRYMQLKWRADLPIRTPVTVINQSGEGLTVSNNWLGKNRLRRAIRRLPGLIQFSPEAFFGRARPRAIARRLGYEGRE